MMKIARLITTLQVWSPSCPSNQLWWKWANKDFATSPTEVDPALPQSPDVSFLPIALRKKLSALNKLGLFLIHNTLSEQQRSTIPIVMSSRFGEVNTMVELLNLIAEDQPSSPMTFSRSVHNATVGIFSIAAGNQNTNSALSAMQDSFSAGLIDALLQLYDLPIGQSLLYAYVDEAIPDLFKPYTQDPVVNYGAAFQLTRHNNSPAIKELYDQIMGCDFLEFMKLLLQDNGLAKRLLIS